MARFSAFRGTTYDLRRVAAADVTAPPYDVVGPAERAELAARSAYNSILVELPEDPQGGDRYEHAAALFREWHERGVVTRARTPRLYLYRMAFTEEGTPHVTTGVFGALGLDAGGAGDVLPHEETTPKDTHDRLSLLRAARTNFSPIWTLSLASGLGQLCERVADGAGEPVRAIDRDGAVHECWALEDEGLIDELCALVGSTPVLIADGHHRYETARAYFEETGGSPGSDAILAFVVELTEGELAVQAIHRLLREIEPEALLRGLEASFDLSPGPDRPLPLGLQEAMEAEGALGLVLEDRSLLLHPKPGLLGEADDELDSTQLTRALERMGGEGVEVVYRHGAHEVAQAVEEGHATAAVLLRPASVAQIRAVAHGGRRMPPKTTFFYPKLLTGMVFRELDA